MKTLIYIDGLNVYNRLVRYTQGLKWLDFEQLLKWVLLPKYPDCKIVKIKYFTSMVVGDDRKHCRQKIYLKALKVHIPVLDIVKGRIQPRIMEGEFIGLKKNYELNSFRGCRALIKVTFPPKVSSFS